MIRQLLNVFLGVMLLAATGCAELEPPEDFSAFYRRMQQLQDEQSLRAGRS